ncbi:envelope component protein [Drosophila suzukii associated hytrosavirus 1]|nr:envelope component protein [Drosophila suzukii associated hytrosavirus 1]
MFKTQTRSRKIYAALGGRMGLIAIIVVAIIVISLIVMYVRKKIRESIEDDDDFLRYQRLIKPYLKIKRENLHFTEESVKFEMDRFDFSHILLPLGDSSQNLTWDTDGEIFLDLCNRLMGLVSYGSDRNSKYYADENLWKIVLYSIKKISEKLPDIPRAYTVPWGTNWYQFSITYPTFLVSAAFSYYETFGKEDAFMTRHLASYINNYYKESNIVNGIYSMGWLRYESNVIGMSVPIIGGRLYANRFDPNANSQKYARDYMSANYVYQDNGFYYDNTYVTHVSRNDGYTTSFYNEFVFIFKFYRMDTKFFKILHKNFSITEHPDFPLHHGPWFSRTSSMRGFAPGRKFARYGVDIRGYARGVCVRTKNISLHYCGQMLPLAAYESDRINKEWAQCWVFMRRPITKTSADRLYTSLVPYYDGVHSYGKKQINWPSVTSTTTVWPPESALCSLAYIQDKAAGMYNKYKIRMADQYNFDIEEINLATPTGFHVYYQCKVDISIANANPYTIACRLGKLDEEPRELRGVGDKNAYAFDDFIGTFLYFDETDSTNTKAVIFLDKVLDPATNTELDALYVQPTPRQVFKFGFSNNFYEYGSKVRNNNLNTEPTMNAISTEEFKVEKLDTEDAILFLHDYNAKMSVVTYAYNYVLPRGIKIKKSVLDEKFKKYDVVNGIFNSSTNEYSVNTYEKQFQMVLRNVVFK